MTNSTQLHEMRRWLDLFETHPSARAQAATAMALIGMRYRAPNRRGRGTMKAAAAAVFSELPLDHFLTQALQDNDPHVQCEAIFALGELAGAEVVPSLCQRLADVASDTRLYAAIVQTLGKIGGQEAFNYLVSLYIKHQDEVSLRSLIGLVVTQRTQDPSFDQAFQREPTLSADEASDTLAVETRRWFEQIRDRQQGQYQEVLVTQIL